MARLRMKRPPASPKTAAGRTPANPSGASAKTRTPDVSRVKVDPGRGPSPFRTQLKVAGSKALPLAVGGGVALGLAGLSAPVVRNLGDAFGDAFQAGGEGAGAGLGGALGLTLQGAGQGAEGLGKGVASGLTALLPIILIGGLGYLIVKGAK